MANGKKVQKIDEIDTVIGPGTKFEGNIEAIGIVRVDGTFNGNIKTQGDVIIGENGRIQGEMIARNMIIAGISHATLTCQGKLEIRSTGQVIGDVKVENIVIEEKAIFRGQCTMNTGESIVKNGVVNA